MNLELSSPSFTLDATFELAERETIGIIGPNGAGKSTLLTQWLAQNRAHNIRTALLEQRALCFPHLTAEENVAFSLQARGVATKDALDRAREDLMSAELAADAARYPHQLSAGQQQRVALLRALATEAEVLLLDEPLTALDVTAAKEYRQTLKNRSVGIRHLVVSTHDPRDLKDLVDRVLVLDAGRIVADVSTAELFASPPNQFVRDFISL